MKDYLAGIINQAASSLQAKNLAREYLQARILESLQRSGAMIPLAFHGGTALRFLYSSGRFSEDLDFSLEGNIDQFRFRSYLQAIQGTFQSEGYQVEVKVNDRKTVNSAFIRFPGLLYELELSPIRNEVLAVKIEVDTHPPQGAVLSTTVIRRFSILQLHHHDQSTLLAGKIHAVLQRPYPKGRDLYDLLWYLSDPKWPLPNFLLLNNALAQTGWQGPHLDVDNWKKQIWLRLKDSDWNYLRDDLLPFIETNFDLNLLSKENISSLLIP